MRSRVKVNGTEWGTIDGPYNQVPDGGEVSLKAGNFYEVIYIYLVPSRSFVLKGGYHDSFSRVIGISTIHGSITIVSGTVIFDNIVIM